MIVAKNILLSRRRSYIAEETKRESIPYLYSGAVHQTISRWAGHPSYSFTATGIPTPPSTASIPVAPCAARHDFHGIKLKLCCYENGISTTPSV